MLPLLLKVGPVAVYSYTVTLSIAFVVAWALARWYLPRRGVARAAATDIVLAAAIGGVVGARLLHVASNWGTYAGHPLWIFMLQRGGLVFYGGLAGGSAAVAAYALSRRLSLAAVADTAALVVPIGSAIGRVGCFLNGCCGGVVTTGPLGVRFPFSAEPLLPAQLFDSVANLAIFAVVMFLATRAAQRPGLAWWTFLMLYGVSRFGMEMLRVNPRYALGLTQAQWISIPVFLAGIAGIVWILGGRTRSKERPDD